MHYKPNVDVETFNHLVDELSVEQLLIQLLIQFLRLEPLSSEQREKIRKLNRNDPDAAKSALRFMLRTILSSKDCVSECMPVLDLAPENIQMVLEHCQDIPNPKYFELIAAILGYHQLTGSITQDLLSNTIEPFYPRILALYTPLNQTQKQSVRYLVEGCVINLQNIISATDISLQDILDIHIILHQGSSDLQKDIPRIKEVFQHQYLNFFYYSHILLRLFETHPELESIILDNFVRLDDNQKTSIMQQHGKTLLTILSHFSNDQIEEDLISQDFFNQHVANLDKNSFIEHCQNLTLLNFAIDAFGNDSELYPMFKNNNLFQQLAPEKQVDLAMNGGTIEDLKNILKDLKYEKLCEIVNSKINQDDGFRQVQNQIQTLNQSGHQDDANQALRILLIVKHPNFTSSANPDVINDYMKDIKQHRGLFKALKNWMVLQFEKLGFKQYSFFKTKTQRAVEAFMNKPPKARH